MLTIQLGHDTRMVLGGSASKVFTAAFKLHP